MPSIRSVIAERDQLKKALWVPPGHYYSPIPDVDTLRRDAKILFDDVPRTLPGIDIREKEQLQLFEELKQFYRDLPFPATAAAGVRFYYENTFYSYSDAIFTFSMLRHLKPKRIIEVGSGFSSALMLDTNERFFGSAVKHTFIEPYPERLYSLISDGDRAAVEVVEKRLQDVDLAVFKELKANDVLFIDSTHCVRTGGDVNRLFFEVLPALNIGVHVHVHDVFYPFEYPREWALAGWAWNEAYLVRAFLQFNSAYRIKLFNTFLHRFHGPALAEALPLTTKNTGGSIWIERF